jgi:hypothetical protein
MLGLTVELVGMVTDRPSITMSPLRNEKKGGGGVHGYDGHYGHGHNLAAVDRCWCGEAAVQLKLKTAREDEYRVTLVCIYAVRRRR